MKNSQSLRTASATDNLSTITDKDLLALCQKYGTQAILWRRKFIGLLPEVNRRELYLKKGFSSIVEFGKKMAGLSEDQIRLAINLEKRFEDKPLLHAALVKGEVSLNKLARVVSVATKENEELLAQSTKVLAKSSLEVLVRDVKLEGGVVEASIKNGHTEAKRKYLSGQDEKGILLNDGARDENGLLKPRCDAKSLPGQTFELSPEVIEKLNALHEKGIDVNEVILKMLEKREADIEERKEEVTGEIMAREKARRENGKEPSRYVGVKTKRIVKEEFGTKCAVAQCVKEAVHLHHAVPFAIEKSNSPDLLKPLCRAHHDIVHSINARYLEKKSKVDGM